MDKKNRFFGLIFLVGLIGALAGAAYLAILGFFFSYLGPDAWLGKKPGHGLILILAGFAIALIERRMGPSGNVEMLVDNIHEMGGNRDRKNLLSLIPASLISIASGGAMGPEAPLVQTTGSFGSWIADIRGLSVSEKRILTITGMAAGFTVLFGAPLGAGLFALEILHRRGIEYYEALLPAIWGSLCGYCAYAVLTGLDLSPIWSFPYSVSALRPQDLFWALFCGLLSAFVAHAFIMANAALRKGFKMAPPLFRGALGGFFLALLALASPYALTFGEYQMRGLSLASPAASFFILAFCAKFLGTSVTASSGWKGGFIIPLFFMGAALGRWLHLIFPSTQETLLVISMMAALNAGVTKTPLGSVLVVTEMSGVRVFPTTILAVMIAMVLTADAGMIESQRSREG